MAHFLCTDKSAASGWAMVSELSGLGGILLFGLGLDLLGVRSFPLLDLSCALPVLPIILWIIDISANF